MLCVPTYVAPSPIAGMGLFAATSIPARTIIWQFTPGADWRIDAADFERFPEPFRENMRHYVYEDVPGVYVLCQDNAKFMNHSETPNCEDPEGEFTITLRAVQMGEELTCDYRTFDLQSRVQGVPVFETGLTGGNGTLRR